MKRSSVLKWGGIGLVAATAVVVGVFLFNSKSSSCRLVLADEAKEHSIMLHNAKGDHACDCFQPIISNVTHSNVTPTSFDVSWHSGTYDGKDGPGTYQVRYGLTASKDDIYPKTTPTTAYVQHTVTVSGLKPNTLYHYGVRGVCLGGCSRGYTGAVKTFQQSPRKDDWTVTTTQGVLFTTLSGTFLNDNGKGIAGITVTLSGGAQKTAVTNASGSYKFDSLAKDKTYTITPTSTAYTFVPPSKTWTGFGQDTVKFNFIGDPKSAIISDLRVFKIAKFGVKEVTPTNVTISWNTPLPASSMVEYGLSTAYGMKSGINQEMVTNHDIQLFELRSGATYHARVVSYPESASGVVFRSEDFSFTTPSTEKRISDKKFIFNEPNPATTWTMFNFNLYQPVKSAVIDVMTLSGKHVASLNCPSSSMGEGWNKVRWDNMSDFQGKPLVNGLYMYRIKFLTPSNAKEEYQFSTLRIAR